MAITPSNPAPSNCSNQRSASTGSVVVRVRWQRPHVVAEFFHLDWTSQARRKLGVPVLHLLEHETIAGQSAGGGEGISGA